MSKSEKDCEVVIDGIARITNAGEFQVFWGIGCKGMIPTELHLRLRYKAAAILVKY